MCKCNFVQVQDAHHKLQNVELAIDANESRARKLEFDLKVMSNMLWQVLRPSQPSMHLKYFKFPYFCEGLLIQGQMMGPLWLIFLHLSGADQHVFVAKMISSQG